MRARRARTAGWGGGRKLARGDELRRGLARHARDRANQPQLRRRAQGARGSARARQVARRPRCVHVRVCRGPPACGRVCTMCARCACARGVRMLCTRAGRRRRTCLARLAFMASVSSGSGSGFATGLAFLAAGLLATLAALSNSTVVALTSGGGEGERQGWRGGRGDGRGAGGGRGPVVGMPLVVVVEGRE